MSFMLKPARSRTFGVPYVGLEELNSVKNSKRVSKYINIVTNVLSLNTHTISNHRWQESVNSPQKQLIFGVLGHVDKVSARMKYNMISTSERGGEIKAALSNREGANT